MQKITLAITFSLAVIVTGCSSKHPTSNNAYEIQAQTITFNPEEALALARVEKNKQKRSTLLLSAASDYWNKNLISQAKAAAEAVSVTDLPQPAQQKYWRLFLNLGNTLNDTKLLQRAISEANKSAFFQTSTDNQKELVRLLVTAHITLKQPLNAAITLIEQAGLFTGEENEKLNEEIWRHLRSTITTNLTQYNYNGHNYDVQGWLALAKAIKLSQSSLNNQYLALLNWTKNWPLHPAVTVMPSELSILSTLPETRPDTIVLALPFSGPLSHVASAIRDGFLASYYTEAPNKNGVNIQTYDTNTRDILNLYNQELPNNTVVIGPLSKKSLSDILNLEELKYKTLALNTTEQNILAKNLYLFSLNPEHETRQIAQRMLEDNKRKTGFIAPQNEWGLRLHDSFSAATSKNGSTLIESAFYSTQKTLADAVAHLLATDQSNERARLVRDISGLRFDRLPRRRQDIDAIFLAAKPNIAKQIKPLLAYHYAQNLPVYSTSQIHEPNNTSSSQDLNNIKFVDMPWMLSSTIGLKNELNSELPKAVASYSRFFALGADTYQLAPRLELLSSVDQSYIEGQTGRLSISKLNTIERELQWAEFKHGKASILGN